MFFQQLINGITIGSTYALVSIGFTMVFGVLELTNFANGSLYMLGAYLSLMLYSATGMNAFLAFFISIILTGGVGYLLDRLALRRLLQYGCTRCLTPAQQQLTRLRYTDGLTVTAIAEQMGLAPSSVSRSLGVIRQRLYRFTEEAGEIGQLCDILRRQLQ